MLTPRTMAGLHPSGCPRGRHGRRAEPQHHRFGARLCAPLRSYDFRPLAPDDAEPVAARGSCVPLPRRGRRGPSTSCSRPTRAWACTSSCCRLRSPTAASHGRRRVVARRLRRRGRAESQPPRPVKRDGLERHREAPLRPRRVRPVGRADARAVVLVHRAVPLLGAQRSGPGAPDRRQRRRRVQRRGLRRECGRVRRVLGHRLVRWPRQRDGRVPRRPGRDVSRLLRLGQRRQHLPLRPRQDAQGALRHGSSPGHARRRRHLGAGGLPLCEGPRREARRARTPSLLNE